MTIVRGHNNTMPINIDGDLTEDIRVGHNNFASIRIAGDCRANISCGANNSGTFSLNGSNFGRIDFGACLLYTSPSPRDATLSRMPSSA